MLLKTPEYNTDDKEISSDSDREDSTEKKILMKKILMRQIKYRMCSVFVFEAFRVIFGYS